MSENGRACGRDGLSSSSGYLEPQSVNNCLLCFTQSEPRVIGRDRIQQASFEERYSVSHPFVCQPLHPPVHLFISICVYVVDYSICPSITPSNRLSIHPPLHRSIHPSISLSSIDQFMLFSNSIIFINLPRSQSFHHLLSHTFIISRFLLHRSLPFVVTISPLCISFPLSFPFPLLSHALLFPYFPSPHYLPVYCLSNLSQSTHVLYRSSVSFSTCLLACLLSVRLFLPSKPLLTVSTNSSSTYEMTLQADANKTFIISVFIVSRRTFNLPVHHKT